MSYIKEQLYNVANFYSKDGNRGDYEGVDMVYENLKSFIEGICFESDEPGTPTRLRSEAEIRQALKDL